jgi:transposase
VPIDPHQLPQDADVLRRMVLDLIAQLDAERARRIKTENLLRQLLAAKSGRRSEQITEEQLALFEAELKAQGVNVEDLSKGSDAGNGPDDKNPPASPDNTGAKRRGRGPLPAHLKRERIVHDLDEAEKHCNACNQDLREFGEETSERYEYIPAQLIVIEDVCRKYSCDCTVKTAGKPSQPIEKSTAGAGLLAQVIVDPGRSGTDQLIQDKAGKQPAPVVNMPTIYRCIGRRRSSADLVSISACRPCAGGWVNAPVCSILFTSV